MAEITIIPDETVGVMQRVLEAIHRSLSLDPRVFGRAGTVFFLKSQTAYARG